MSFDDWRRGQRGHCFIFSAEDPMMVHSGEHWPTPKAWTSEPIRTGYTHAGKQLRYVSFELFHIKYFGLVSLLSCIFVQQILKQIGRTRALLNTFKHAHSYYKWLHFHTTCLLGLDEWVEWVFQPITVQYCEDLIFSLLKIKPFYTFLWPLLRIWKPLHLNVSSLSMCCHYELFLQLFWMDTQMLCVI